MAAHRRDLRSVAETMATRRRDALEVYRDEYVVHNLIVGAYKFDCWQLPPAYKSCGGPPVIAGTGVGPRVRLSRWTEPASKEGLSREHDHTVAEQLARRPFRRAA
ncbi:MAG: hypothetical protein QOF70_6259 [Acetobacteraceae bacterium]|jgi:hypothetical protein|nr:hypothetical protein [Acetobacteraceae bacterium]